MSSDKFAPLGSNKAPLADTPKIYSRTASMVRTRSGGQGLNDLSTKFKRFNTQNSGVQTGNSSSEMVHQGQASRPGSRPSSRAGRGDFDTVNNGSSTPKYETMVAASENRVKFADTHAAQSDVAAGSAEDSAASAEESKQPVTEAEQQHGLFAGRHWSEVPRSDARGQVLSFDEGDVRVIEGADGRIIKQNIGSSTPPGQSGEKDLSAEERNVGLTADQKQEAREEMPDSLTEEQKMQAYKEKRMRRDVG